ncbi:MAG: cobyrinate a,c-diamide synthase [Aminipila sp.]
MQNRSLPRILIAAPGSGSGKTTVVCGILQALINKGLNIMSFKCGPDYIDPMFHKEALGLESRNLDLFFNDENTVKYLMAKNTSNTDIAIIEGVMGFYDGIAGKSYEASSYDLARKTQTPVVLILDCKGKSVSILAEIKGFMELEDDCNIKGVILNRISPMIYEEIKLLIEQKCNVKVIGYMPEMKECSLESRHLGLVTAQEIGNIKEILNLLASQAEKSIDLQQLIELCNTAPHITYSDLQIKKGETIKIGVARDKAFCFYYQDNLDLLTELGAEILFFSPLYDRGLPEGVNGLYFGGGYPELYLKELEDNLSMLNSIKNHINQGIPCMAECGGFMYLHEFVEDREKTPYKGVGVIKGKSSYVGKLVRFGYIDMLAEQDNLLCEKGESIKGHEFHYWDSDNCGECFHAQKPMRKKNWKCVVGNEKLYAGYPHIHFYSNIKSAERFVEECRKTKISI